MRLPHKILLYQIYDIHCEKCVEKIRKALENLAGLEEVHFNLDEIEKTIEGSMKLGINGIIC